MDKAQMRRHVGRAWVKVGIALGVAQEPDESCFPKGRLPLIVRKLEEAYRELDAIVSSEADCPEEVKSKSEARGRPRGDECPV